MRRLAAVLLACLAAAAIAGTDRDRRVRYAFRAAHPCPATGETRGACPGYVVDHIVPLCAGGPDTVANMQWLTIEAAREKDRPWLASCPRRGPGKKFLPGP